MFLLAHFQPLVKLFLYFIVLTVSPTLNLADLGVASISSVKAEMKIRTCSK